MEFVFGKPSQIGTALASWSNRNGLIISNKSFWSVLWHKDENNFKTMIMETTVRAQDETLRNKGICLTKNQRVELLSIINQTPPNEIRWLKIKNYLMLVDIALIDNRIAWKIYKKSL